MSTSARTSSENVTLHFCNHFTIIIIQSHYTCKMCSNHPWIKLETALLRLEDKIEQMLMSSTQLQNRSFCVLERTRTFAKCTKIKMHVQSFHNYWFSYVKINNQFVLLLLLSLSSWMLKLPINWHMHIPVMVNMTLL